MKSERARVGNQTGAVWFRFRVASLAILHCVLLNSREPASWETT